jgi:hypothetical protein
VTSLSVTVPRRGIDFFTLAFRAHGGPGDPLETVGSDDDVLVQDLDRPAVPGIVLGKAPLARTPCRLSLQASHSAGKLDHFRIGKEQDRALFPAWSVTLVPLYGTNGSDTERMKNTRKLLEAADDRTSKGDRSIRC